MSKDVEIKKNIYIEFESKDNIINIKEELFNSMKNLKDEDLVHSSSFRLEDTMAAIVVNHYKMDPHSHNEKICNINDKQLKLKKLYTFEYKDTLYTIFDIFKKEISLFYNASIHECILENSLFFINEENINANNFSDISNINYNIITSFTLSFKYLIYLLFHSISKTSCLRDEDLPTFLYSNSINLNYPKSVEFLQKILENLEKVEKKEENKNYIEQIITLIKLQKGIIGILQIFFNDKEIKLTKDNYDKVINSILEEVNKINYEIYPKEIEQNKNIYIKEIYKLMPVLGTYKKCKIFTDKECLEKFKELLNDFKEIRRIFNTTNLYHLYKLIHNINSKKEMNCPSFIIRHLLDINILNQENNLFGNKATKKIFKNFFNEYEISTNISLDEKNKNEENDLLPKVIEIYQEILKYELKNKARKVREARELINNIVGLVIFIYKKEKEINEENQNSHQHKNLKDLSKTFMKNFVVFKLLTLMLYIIFNCFNIDFFKFYELDYIFFISETISDQILKHIYLFAKKIDDKDILNENNIANSEKKKNLKDEKKVIFDEIYIYNSYKNAFKGLKLLLYYIKYYKLIKIPNLKEADIIARINNRLPFFKHCSMIINLSYEEFMKDYNENIVEIENSEYINSSKEFLQNAKNNLMELIKADQHLRDIFMNGNEELNGLSKVIISNSLLFNKIKKFKEEKKENEFLKFNINLSKYNSKFPLIELLK
jgi:hypothetical protein